jgi:hypothetical protein
MKLRDTADPSRGLGHQAGRLMAQLGVVCLGGLSACVSSVPEGSDAKSFEGDAAGECSNGADDDQDGFFDCDDNDCARSPDCTDAGAADGAGADDGADGGPSTDTGAGAEPTGYAYGAELDDLDDVGWRASDLDPDDWAEFEPLGELDWRFVGGGMVTPVRDQGPVGSCTIFAVVGAVESAAMIQRGFESRDLSEQFLIDCSDELDADGNNMEEAVDAFVDLGTTTEDAAPYLEGDGPSSACRSYGDPVLLGEASYVVYGREDMKKALHFGPIVIGFDVYDDFDDHWDSESWTPYRHSSRASRTGGGHAVLVVGYSDEDQAWIIKNSWGTDGGVRGFTRISFDEDGVRPYAYLVRVGSEAQFLNGLSLLELPTDNIDLVGGAPSVSDTTPSAGDAITVSGNITNAGTASSGSTTVGVYLSNDSSFSSSDTLLTTASLSSISAGGSRSYSASATIPSSASGSMYVIAVVDPSGAITETDESNNAGARSISIAAPATTIDLVGGAPSVSDTTPSAGDAITVSGNITNAGTASSGSTTVGVYLSNDSSFSSSDTLLTTASLSSISAGGSRSYSASATIPSSASGSKYIVAVVDPSDLIVESSESNNAGARSITVAPPTLTAVNVTDTGAWCTGSGQDIFEATGISIGSSTTNPTVTATFRKCDGTSFSSTKNCHVRVGSYTGSYSSSLARASFTWSAGSSSRSVTWNAWPSSADFAAAVAGDIKDFYLICEETATGGSWNHWRAENPIVVEVR